jgi:hypothetical protein
LLPWLLGVEPVVPMPVLCELIPPAAIKPETGVSRRVGARIIIPILLSIACPFVVARRCGCSDQRTGCIMGGHNGCSLTIIRLYRLDVPLSAILL